MSSTLSTSSHIGRPVDGHPRRRRVAAYGWFLLSAVAIAVFAPLPYLSDSLQNLAGQNDIAANYASRPPWIQAAFYVHVVGGGIALLLSPLQFAASLRARVPRLHRIAGRIVLASIGLAGVAGLVLAPLSLAGPVGTAGFGTLAVLWVTFAAAALRAIRRGDVGAHRRWVVRTFALTYAAVTLRLWLGALIAVQVALLGVDGDAAFARAYLLVPFLSWIPNLLVAELLLRRGTLGPAAGRSTPGGDRAGRTARVGATRRAVRP
jgi:uncharacterized membrane protein